MPRRKICFFTKNKINYIDYKDVEMLNRFIAKNGKIVARRISGTKSKFQRPLAKAIKRARVMGLIGYSSE